MKMSCERMPNNENNKAFLCKSQSTKVFCAEKLNDEYSCCYGVVPMYDCLREE